MATRGRKPTPTAIKELEGNPEGAQAGEEGTLLSEVAGGRG